MPKKLFKYRAIDEPGYTARIFTNRELYFAAPIQFNDPFESRFVLSFEGTSEQRIRKFVSVLARQHPNWSPTEVLMQADHLASRWTPDPVNTESISERFRTDHGVLSLSAVRDDILMWSHYGDHHCGICLEFTVDRAAFLGARVMPVEYCDDYPILRYFLDKDFDNVTTTALRKAKHWKYEQEWRVVDPFNGRGAQVFPPELLTGVILGAVISPVAEKLVRNWVSGFGSPMTIYRARLKERSLGLDIVKD